MQNILAILAVAALSSVAIASEDFAKKKAEVLSHLEERSQKLAEHKACITAAASEEALKACREKMKAHHHDEKMERLEGKKARLEEKLKAK